MILTILLYILLYLATALLIWQFVAYPLLMAILALKKKDTPKDYSYQPAVSILVPTFNEETVIEDRIFNLFAMEYPLEKMEVLVVDSGSKDNTRNITERIIKEHPEFPLKLLVEKERNGKASAINFGKKNASFDIVLVTDANTIFEEDVLKEMMPYFKDPKIGAVGGRNKLPKQECTLTSSNMFYLDLECIMRTGESFLDSACLFHGEINAWRKDIVDADETVVSEDLDMAIQIRRKGYKVEYEPKAVFYEASPDNTKDLVIQKKRNSIGTLKNLFKHLNYWIPPRNWYSFLIFPSHKGLAMFSPFLILTIPVLYLAIYLLIGNLNFILVHILLSGIVFAGLFMALLYLKSKLIKGNGSRFSIKSLPKIIYYVLLNEYIVFRAWIDFTLGKYSVLWEKVDSTR